MFGIGMGPSNQQKQAYGGLKSLSGFASTHGQGDITSSEDFFRGILSGDPTKQAAVLAPEISGIKNRAEQQKLTTSEFGTRSGGNNAFMQQTDDNVSSAINKMIDEMTVQGAEYLGNMGMNLTSQGASDYSHLFDEAHTMQQQEQAKWGDIFNSISGIAGTVGGFFPAGGKVNKVLTGIAGAI